MVLRIRFVACAVSLLIAAGAYAQTTEQRAQCERDFSPRSGQAGKDVIWVPTPDALVMAMLKAANVTATDVVYDLGAGDGKIPIAAAKTFGARAIGIEYNPQMVRLANCLAQAAGVTDKAKIIEADIFQTDFSEATVLTLYLLPSLNEKLMPTILKMKPGTRVVSHSFRMGEWQPDQDIDLNEHGDAYLWIVPAQLKGMWTLEAPGKKPITLNLDQRYQNVWGEANENGKPAKIEKSALRGDRFELSYAGANGVTSVKGSILQDRIEATVSTGNQSAGYVGRRR